MKRIIVAPLWSPAILHAAETPAKKPSILLTHSDDHGSADLGAQGVARTSAGSTHRLAACCMVAVALLTSLQVVRGADSAQ
jgi:hypothetical protein